MSRRIDIELTSALDDGTWTWRAAGAKQPKGVLPGDILAGGAAVGDVIKVEVDQEIDGITVRSVVGGREKQDRADLLEMLPSEREFKPVIETRAKRDRGGRDGRDGDRRPRRDRGGRNDRGGRDDRGGRGDRGDRGAKDGRDGTGRGRDDRGRGRDDRGGGRDDRGGGRDDRGGGRGRGRPSFTPPPELPKRPKPKRLRPGKANRSAVLAELPEAQRPIAELALQGMGAVRQRLKEENAKAAEEGRAVMPEASVLKLAEDLIPKLRVAEWKDRAEAAQRQMEHLDLRDLRSVVAAGGDPVVARDDSTTALASELSGALVTKQEQELTLWFGDVDAALAVGRVIRALRLSSQPPKAGVPFPVDIAQRLLESANAALAPMDSPERWAATLEAAAFSPIHKSVQPARKPDAVNDELLATVKRLAPALPLVAALFEIEVDPKRPMPKPLRPGPRNKKGKDGDRSRGRSERSRGRSERSTSPERGKRGRPKADAQTSPGTGSSDDAAPESTTSSAPDSSSPDGTSPVGSNDANQPAAPPTAPEPEPTALAAADSEPAPATADVPAEPAPQPAPATADEPTAELASEPAPATADEPAAEPASEPEPATAAEPAAEPAPATADVPAEPAPEPEPATADERAAEPASEPEPATAAEPAAEPAPATADEPTAELAPEPEPATADEPAAEPASEPEPATADEPAAEPASEPEPATAELASEAASEPASEPEPAAADEPPADAAADVPAEPASEPAPAVADEPPADAIADVPVESDMPVTEMASEPDDSAAST